MMANAKTFPVINLEETGRCIEKHRRQAGLSVRDVQSFFGFEYPQAIYKWQHGECLPTVDNLLALSKLLQVSMEDLLVYDDQGVSFLFGTGINQRFKDRALRTWYPMLIRRGQRAPAQKS